MRLPVRSTGGFWLLLGALLLVASGRLLCWVAVACLVHELGHAAAIRLLGGRVGPLRLTGVGAQLRPERARLFTYAEECAIAAAGPAASLLLAGLAGTWARQTGSLDAYLLTGVSLALGAFNLLPAGALDGGRILRAALCLLRGPETGARWGRWLTCGVAGTLGLLGLWAWRCCGNFTLLLCAAWLGLARGRGDA